MKIIRAIVLEDHVDKVTLITDQPPAPIYPPDESLQLRFETRVGEAPGYIQQLFGDIPIERIRTGAARTCNEVVYPLAPVPYGAERCGNSLPCARHPKENGGG